jgi:protein required for attachment to host cells
MAKTASAALAEKETLNHPESRQHTQELTTDLPGKGHDANSSGHHGMDVKNDPHAQEVTVFAREVCEHLRNGLTSNHFNNIVLIAEPSFLGALRNTMDKLTQKHVSLEINKNLVKHSPEDIRDHLPKRLPSTT